MGAVPIKKEWAAEWKCKLEVEEMPGDNDVIVLDTILKEKTKTTSLRTNDICVCLQKTIQNTG